MERSGSKKWRFASPNLAVSAAGERSIQRYLLDLHGCLHERGPRPVIPLSHGDPSSAPSFRTAPEAVEAVVSAVRSGEFNGYPSPATGLSARLAIAEYLSRDLPYKLFPDDIVLTSGCTQAIEIVMSVFGQPGFNVLLPRPGYPKHEAHAIFHNMEVRHYDLVPERDWEVDLEAVEALADENTVAIVITNPNNPCGSVYTYEHLSKIAGTANKLGILVIADEVYGHLVYGSTPFVPMGVFGETVPILTLGAISKRWAVPGWRLGWIAACDPKGILKEAKVSHSLTSFGMLTTDPATFVQGAIPHIMKNTNDEFFSKITKLLKETADAAAAAAAAAAKLDGGGGGGMEAPGLGDTRFDASQYAFFGNNVMEEIELGGLEDDNESNAAFVGLDGIEHPLSSQENALEAEDIGSFSDVDDLANTFSKLRRDVNEPKHIGINNRGVPFSRESPAAANWAPEFDSPCWPDQYVLGAKQEQDGNGWWSLQNRSSHFADSRLHRTSSSPQQQEQHNPNEPFRGPRPSPLHRTSSYPHKEPQYNPTGAIPAPKSPYISHPPPGGPSSSLSGQPHQMNTPPFNEFQMHMPAQSEPPLSQFPRGVTPPESFFGGNLDHMVSTGFSTNKSGQQNHLLNNGPGEAARIMPNLVQNYLQRPNGFVPPQMVPMCQQHGMLPIQQSPQHLSRMQAQMFGPQHPPRMMNRFDNFGMPELSDPRARSSMHHGRQGYRFPLEGSEFGIMRMDNGRPRFSSRYMSTEELENISRIQHAATHINDPYIDDYYHQACLARRSVDARLKHHFCPTLIRDPSSRARSKDDPHAYLKVDALGRLPFSSIRRPRQLLDVEPASTTDDNTLERSVSKPLDQEPMLAARITVEDGLCLLLDIDDNDRLLQFSQQQDGGLQLRNRRQSLLGQLAESLQLVDPLGSNKTAHLSPNDDWVFLRVVSLPKGRKLLSRYLNLMVPGSDLARIACMTVFRHLRFVFGNLPSDYGSAETVTKLASAVAACIRGTDLSGLSACLAAIVCSSEHPPLRPLGYAAGDGATVIIKSVLDRATELLTEQLAASNYSVPNRDLWQASFNAFYGLLTKYCVSKFDSLVHTMHKNPAAATVISKELPIELLRASLPHTDEQQRRLLLEFAQRTVPVTGHTSHGAAGGPMTSESVPS